MAKKGESYAQVKIDLGKWALDYMRINNLNQSQLANRIYDENGNPVNRARITDMIAGRQNTMKFLQMIVNSLYAGGYESMGRYAMDEAGEKTLAILNMEKNLSKSEEKVMKEHYELFMKAVAEKDMSKVKECIKILKK